MCSTSSQCQYISLDQLSPAGAIFVTAEDPLSLAFNTLTRTVFSCRGFYYTTTITGTKKVKLILRNYYNDVCPLWMSDPNGISIHDLMSYPFVTHICVKPLLLTSSSSVSSKEIENVFRTVVAETMSTLSQLSLEDSMSRVFSEIEEEDLLNKVQLNMLEKLKLDTSSLFEQGVYLTVPLRPSYTTEYMSASYRDDLNDIIDRLCQDKELFDKTVKHIKHIAEGYSYDNTTLRRLLRICLDNESTLLFKLLKWIESGDISYNELRNLLAMINNQRREISLILNDDSTPSLVLPEVKSNLLLKVNVDKSYTHKESIMSNAIKDLHGEISRIVKTIHNNEPIYIDINSIIKCMNIISSHVETDLNYIKRVDEDSSYPAIVVTRDDHMAELPLKNGTTLTLPLKRAELKSLSKEVLIEILEILDSLVENDKRYDDLRVAITKQLAIS